MRDEELKERIGLFVIVSHFLCVVLVVVFFLMGGFEFDEMTTIISLVLPVFAVYTSGIVKYIISRKHKSTKGRLVSKSYAFISFLMPVVFIAAVFSVITLSAFNYGFSSFEQLKYMLGLVEVVFGAYMGVIMASMYELDKQK